MTMGAGVPFRLARASDARPSQGPALSVRFGTHSAMTPSRDI
jgi:hypothetical protein